MRTLTSRSVTGGTLTRHKLLALSLLVAALMCSPVQSQEGTTEPETEPSSSSTSNSLEGQRVIRVEEDWIIDVANPDPNHDIPQIVTVFGPDDPNLGTHGVFEVNSSTIPDFIDGGMQLQCWHRESHIGSRRHVNGSELAIGVERVRYTTSVELKDDRLILEIKNGDSVTFGTFGGQGQLKIALWTWRDSLNNYNTGNSIRHSRISFGSNRVTRFLRAETRYYTAAGDVVVDETDTYVHRAVDADLSEAPVNAPATP